MPQLLAFALISGSAYGQNTKSDLRSQARNVDFSGAAATKPAKTGATLPLFCSVGELFFLTSAPSGRNLYGCVADNTWNPITPPPPSFSTITGIAAISQGGTGAADPSGARTNLGAAAAVHTHVLTDLSGITGKHGSAGALQVFGGGTANANDCAKFDSSGNLVSTGAPCAAADTGAALPSLCSMGELFFLTSAPAGQNLYACAAGNTWSPVTPPTPSFSAITGIAALAQGGTGAADPSGARTNLGAAAAVHTHVLTDLSGITGKHGSAGAIQAFGGGTVNTNDCAKFDSSGNLISTGAPCAPAGLTDPGADGVISRNGAGLTVPATAAQMSGPNFCYDAGATDAYACNLSPAITAYTTGTLYWFKANTPNTGGATINFNATGALPLKKPLGGIATDLNDNDIRAGQWVAVVYDGANAQVLSGLGNQLTGGLQTISYSATPAYVVAAGGGNQTFQTTLTGNAAPTLDLTNALAGQIFTFEIIQDSSGAHAFTPPAQLNGPCSVDTSANGITLMVGTYDGTNVQITSCANPSATPTFIAGFERPAVTATVANGGTLSFASGSHTAEYYANNSSNRHIMPRCSGSTDQCSISDILNGGIRSIGYVFDGGGSALTTRNSAAITIPFACNIAAWNINVDGGTATVKVWKTASGAAIPTVGNSINTSGIAISAGTAIHSTTLTDFTTTSVAPNDIAIFSLTSVAGATQVYVGLECRQ